MVSTIKGKVAKMAFLVGLVVAFISLFLDEYYYMAHVSGTVIAEWSFNSFFGWRTPFIEGISSNEVLRPNDTTEVLVMAIILIALILISAYGTMIKSIETTNSIDTSKPYIYLNVLMLMILGYFIVIMPFTFLFPNDLYFPFMIIEDLDTNIIHSYFIGPAYMMQVSAFLMCFPQVLFSVLTLGKFESEKRSPEALIRRTLEDSLEEIPLEKFIAELDSESRSKEEVSILYEKFQRQRRRRMK